MKLRSKTTYSTQEPEISPVSISVPKHKHNVWNQESWLLTFNEKKKNGKFDTRLTKTVLSKLDRDTQPYVLQETLILLFRRDRGFKKEIYRILRLCIHVKCTVVIENLLDVILSPLEKRSRHYDFDTMIEKLQLFSEFFVNDHESQYRYDEYVDYFLSAVKDTSKQVFFLLELYRYGTMPLHYRKFIEDHIELIYKRIFDDDPRYIQDNLYIVRHIFIPLFHYVCEVHPERLSIFLSYNYLGIWTAYFNLEPDRIVDVVIEYIDRLRTIVLEMFSDSDLMVSLLRLRFIENQFLRYIDFFPRFFVQMICHAEPSAERIVCLHLIDSLVPLFCQLFRTTATPIGYDPYKSKYIETMRRLRMTEEEQDHAFVRLRICSTNVCFTLYNTIRDIIDRAFLHVHTKDPGIQDEIRSTVKDIVNERFIAEDVLSFL